MPDQVKYTIGNLSRHGTILASFALVLILAITDLATNYINIPILYFIPITLCAKAGRRRPLVWLTALVVVLTYALYFFDFNGPTSSFGLKLWYRLINRTMVAGGLCVTATIMSAWTRVHEEWQRRAASMAEAEQDLSFDQAVTSLKRVIVIMLCSMMIFFIFVTDLMAPRQFNLPILYAVPLMIAAWADSRRLIWILLPILLTFTWVGYFAGAPLSLSPESAPPNVLQLILTNRLLATLAQIGIALIVHFAMTPRPPRETRGFDVISQPKAVSS